jgi:hypothetical protein
VDRSAPNTDIHSSNGSLLVTSAEPPSYRWLYGCLIGDIRYRVDDRTRDNAESPTIPQNLSLSDSNPVCKSNFRLDLSRSDAGQTNRNLASVTPRFSAFGPLAEPHDGRPAGRSPTK